AFSAELPLVRKDGHCVWVRVGMQPLAQAGEDAVVLTLQDITTHQAARASVRASEARLQVAMQASELSMWDWNVVRDEVYYNDQWRDSIGVDPKELLGRQALHERLMLPDDPKVLDAFE